MIRSLFGAALLAAALGAAPSRGQTTFQDGAPTSACLARFAVVGLPVHRGDDVALKQVKICRDGYALSFNKATRNPDWVIERLTPEALKGEAKRADKFLTDPAAKGFSPTPQDYTDPVNPRDRGHQAPAADFKFSQPQTNASFYMTNMSPQVGPGFNRAQWRFLEEDVRAAVLCGGHQDVIVITGPIYGASSTWIGQNKDKILSPAAYFKVLYDVQRGRAVGFRLDNKGFKKTPSETFIVPISQLEVETGLDFLSELSRRDQNMLERSKGAFWGHGHDCKNGVRE